MLQAARCPFWRQANLLPDCHGWSLVSQWPETLVKSLCDFLAYSFLLFQQIGEVNLLLARNAVQKFGENLV